MIGKPINEVININFTDYMDEKLNKAQDDEEAESIYIEHLKKQAIHIKPSYRIIDNEEYEKFKNAGNEISKLNVVIKDRDLELAKLSAEMTMMSQQMNDLRSEN